MDKMAKWVTISILFLILCCFTYFYLRSTGSYLPAWFTILIFALLTLLALSIPRYVTISGTSMEIHCIMELTAIPIKNIKNIRPISKKRMQWCLPVPLLGIWGVFGYYGYYFDFKSMKLFKLFSSHWDDFIRIEDIYEDVIVISCHEYAELISQVKNNKGI